MGQGYRCPKLALLLFLHLPAAVWAIGIQPTGGEDPGAGPVTETLHIHNDMGIFDVPVAQVERVETAGTGIVLTTIWGERLSGEPEPAVLTLRQAGGEARAVPVALLRRQHDAEGVALDGPDLLEFRNGDRLRVRIVDGDYLIKTAQSMQMLHRDQLRTLSLAGGSEAAEERAQVMARFNTPGAMARGELINGRIAARSAYGQALSLPVNTVKRVMFDALPADLAPAESLALLEAPWRLAGRTFHDRLPGGDSGPEMVVLRGGRFLRGDLMGDGDLDEQPVSDISLEHPFAIGLHEVTFADYDRFCTAAARPCPEDSGWGRGGRPVVNVTWEDARAYTAWLSEQTGKRYRLPTDAEWEYAARGGTTTRYWWGSEAGTARANCAGCDGLWDGERSAPVGEFPPNPFGLYDTAGNVWEWVADCYYDTFAQAPADGGALDKPGCGKRVIRGGAWSFPPVEMRSANRWRDFPSRQSDDTGFRVLRELDF